MKITDVRTVLLTGPCTKDPFLSEFRKHRSAAFIEIHTDTGLIGVGESYNGYRCAELHPPAVAYFAPILMGRNVDDVPQLWQWMYQCEHFWCRSGFGIGVINGIEAALWDLKGKHYGVPIHEFLGGRVRDKIRVYAWIGGDSPSEVAPAARRRMAEGFTAIKMNASSQMHYIDSFAKVDDVLARVGAVREATGKSFDIAIDFHGRIHKGMAKVLAKELEALHPFFLEEPVLPEHNEALREIAQHTTIPIATGERLYSRWDFKQLLHDGYVDIIQPDVSHAGGISEVRKIATMAEAYDVAVAPHCPLGPIALASCLQIDACTHNALIQEQSLNIHYNVQGDLLDYLADPSVFAYQDGYVAVPRGPGLGLTINEDAVRRAAAQGHSWRSPVWRTDDGSVAEW